MKKIVLLLAAVLMGFSAFCQRDINIQMVYVKGGNFFRGSDDPHYSDVEFDNERPVHRVNISGYSIGKYEITQGQWRTIMGILPLSYSGVNYDNKDCNTCPVVKVSYDDIQEFIKKINLKYPGKNYRLPTELEWEYAARGGQYSGNFKYSGSDKLSEVGWYGRKKGETHPVGTKTPNELGIYDMSGNVMEWCSDWYDAEYYKTTTDAFDPKGPATGDKRVVRGGSYFDDDVMCRNVYRNRLAPATKRWDLGFRLAMDN